MARYWLVTMTEEDYQYTIKNGIYGLPEKSSKLRELIKPGDKLVVYITRKGCKELCESFTAILEVAGWWRMPGRPTLLSEIREGKVSYSWVVDVRVITTGRVSINSIKGELTRILGKDVNLTEDYTTRELPSSVGALIEERLKAKPGTAGVEEQSESEHEELVNAINDVAKWLGFRVETEYHIDEFRVDAALFKEPMAVPFAVVEVHVSGDIHKDLASLKHAYDKYRAKPIYVIARDEEVVAKLLQGAFHEVKGKIIILRAWELKQLHEVLRQENVKRFINELTQP